MKLLCKNNRLIFEVDAFAPTKPTKVNITRDRTLSQAPVSGDLNEIGSKNLGFLYNSYEFGVILKKASGDKFRNVFTVEERKAYTTDFVKQVPLLSQAKITHHLGSGSFGSAFALDNGHVIKIYYASFVSGVTQYADQTGFGDKQRYNDLYDKAFTGKASKSDLMIFDQGTAKVANGWMLHWAEMPSLKPLSSIYGEKWAHSDAYMQLGEDIDMVKDMSVIYYAREVLRMKSDTEPGVRDIIKHITFDLKAPLKNFGRPMYMEELLDLSTEEAFSTHLLKMEPIMAKKLMSSIWDILAKEGSAALKDIRLMNIGVLEQDPTTPVIFDY
jgi:hypothetical protein